MKRTLLLLLLSVSTLWGQFLPDIPDRLSYVAQFNGSTQYFSKTSSVNMDLNGSEMLTNPTLDVDITGWAIDGNVALAHETTIKRTGAGSCKITYVTTGGIKSTPINNTSTNKFTLEAWVYIPAASVTRVVRIGLRNQSGALIQGETEVTLVADTWTKIVRITQCNGTQTSLILWVRLPSPTAGDIFYLDDVSLTQAYDGIVGLESKTTNGSTQTLAGSSKSNGSRLRIWQNTTTASVTLTDGTISVTATNSATVNDGRPHRWGVAWSRTGNLTLYIDGVAGTGQSIAGVGAVTVDTLWIGRDEAGNDFNGQIGEKVQVKYSTLPTNIANWIVYVNTQRYIPEPPGGGETVLRIFGRRNDALDQSGNQGVLTNTGATPIIPR